MNEPKPDDLIYAAFETALDLTSEILGEPWPESALELSLGAASLVALTIWRDLVEAQSCAQAGAYDDIMIMREGPEACIKDEGAAGGIDHAEHKVRVLLAYLEKAKDALEKIRGQGDGASNL